MSREFQIKHKKSVISHDRQREALNGRTQKSSLKIQSDDEIEKKFWSKYFYEGVLGRGGSSIVVLIRSKTGGQKLACKIIDRTKISEEVFNALKREPKLLNKFSKSKQIVGLVESFESAKRLFILMDYMKGGNLLDYIKKRSIAKRPFRESEVALVIFNLLQALKSIHSYNVIHGDLKPGKTFMTRQCTARGT